MTPAQEGFENNHFVTLSLLSILTTIRQSRDRHEARRYPPDSVTSNEAFEGSGSIFCRSR